MKTFVVLRWSVYRAAVAVLPAPVMLTVLVGTIFFKPKPIGWFRSSESFPLTVTIVYPLFMNHIITGDERNVKNLETQVYVSWGMSFNDGQISSQKVNLKHTLLSAGNATYAIRQSSERRIWSGTLPHGELSAIYLSEVNHKHLFLYLFRRNVKRVWPQSPAGNVTLANRQQSERRIWSGTLPPPRKSPLYLRGWYKGLSFGL